MCLQALLGERLAVVSQPHVGGVDDEQTILLVLTHMDVGGGFEVAVDDHLGAVVLEDPGIGPFDADQGVGEHRETPVVALDHRLLPCDRSGVTRHGLAWAGGKG